MKNKNTIQGFTLPEVIVGIAVLVMVIVSATNLLVSIIRSNNDNMNTIVAYELAQEGLEGMRNIRDSNWLLAADFQGSIQHANKVWGATLPDKNGAVAYFTLDYGNTDQSFNPNVQLNDISNYSPWVLKDVTPINGGEPTPQQTQLFIHKIGQGEKAQTEYVHAKDLGDSGSLFSRYIKVEAFGNHGPELTKYRITSVVTWKQDNRDKNVSLTTELTNWKGGPL